jgi:hypothetical protein
MHLQGNNGILDAPTRLCHNKQLPEMVRWFRDSAAAMDKLQLKVLQAGTFGILLVHSQSTKMAMAVCIYKLLGSKWPT